MKSPRYYFCCLALLVLSCNAHAQITLTGTAYLQDFNAVATGLPAGWSVHTSTTLSELGNPATFTTAATTWASVTALTDFRNVASDNIAFGSTSGTQSSDLNRALGWKPLAAATDARTGSIMLTLSDTDGFADFSLSVRVFTPSDSSASSQTYSFEYRVGSSGNFTPLATYITPTTGASGFNAQTFTADSTALAALDDQPDPVYFRLRGTATTGTSLDTVGFDDFSLGYSAAAVPEPSTYAAIFGAVALMGAASRRRRRRPNPGQ